MANTTLGDLTDRYLTWAETNLAPITVVWYRRHLGAFTAFVGRPKPLEDLVTLDCISWVESTTWGQSTRRGAITAVKRLFAWGVIYGMATTNPFKPIERPSMGRREVIPTTAEVNELVDGARGGTRDYLTFLAETGCRQSEVYKLTAQHVDLAAGVCVMHGKTTRKTGRPRVIYLSEAAKAIVSRRMKGLSRGDHLFTTRAGTPWSLKSTKDAVMLIRRRLGLGGHVTAGSLRHWWVTERLRAGVSIAIVAHLAGHTSTAMISRHYGHLETCGAELRQAIELRAR